MSLLGIPLGFYSIADLKTICLAGCQHSFWHLGKPGFHEPFNNSTPPSSSSRKPATKQQLLSSRYCVTDHHGSEDPSRRKKNFEAGKTLWATAPQLWPKVAALIAQHTHKEAKAKEVDKNLHLAPLDRRRLCSRSDAVPADAHRRATHVPPPGPGPGPASTRSFDPYLRRRRVHAGFLD